MSSTVEQVHVAVVLAELAKGEVSVSEVHASLPRAYMDVEVFWAKTEYDADRNPVLWQTDLGAEGNKRYPFLVLSCADQEVEPEEAIPYQHGEYEATFVARPGGFKTVRILDAESLDVALTRLRETYPDANIESLEKRRLDWHPADYLDSECLVVKR
jgi:hypothetical protein